MPIKSPTYRPRGQRDRGEQRQEAEARRGTARERGYTAAWDRAAATYKRRHPLCLGCEAVAVVAVCEVIDHIIPHQGDPALMWDRANWQPACRWHHDRIKQQLEHLWRVGRITAADLRLDSARARALTCDLQG